VQNRAADQGLALRTHFEDLIAACGLSGPRGKLRNRINTFLSSPLSRGADELCIMQHEIHADLKSALENLKES
jgi:hypothetical protein